MKNYRPKTAALAALAALSALLPVAAQAQRRSPLPRSLPPVNNNNNNNRNENNNSGNANRNLPNSDPRNIPMSDPFNTPMGGFTVPRPSQNYTPPSSRPGDGRGDRPQLPRNLPPGNRPSPDPYYNDGRYNERYDRNYNGNWNNGSYYNGGGFYPNYGPAVIVNGQTVYGRPNATFRDVNGGTISVFGGYSNTFIAGQTILSPFGSLYGSPLYLNNNYVLFDAYPYAYAREAATIWTYNALAAQAQADAQARLNAQAQAQLDAQAQAPSRALPQTRGGASDQRALTEALQDISAFWEEGNARPLRRRVASDSSVGIYQSEKYAYSLRRADFLSLFADAEERVETLSFRFREVRERTDGLVNAYATHRYKVRGEKETRSAEVRVTLQNSEGDWYISAVSLAPDALGESSALEKPSALPKTSAPPKK